MSRPPLRVLLEGRPGVGKTTVARRVVERLREAGIPVSGFTTEEIREGRRRVGFRIESVAGERAVMAHVGIPGRPRVGRYGVDVRALERVAIPALDSAEGVAVVDELGKMELASPSLREAVDRLLARDLPFVATVHTFAHPFTDGLKRRPDIELTKVTEGNRDALPETLVERLVEGGTGS